MIDDHHADLLRLARKYVWWCQPEDVIENKLDKLVVQVMELGTWEDAHALLNVVGRERYLAVLDAPPPGAISSKSLAFWHGRLGRPGDPPKATKRTFR